MTEANGEASLNSGAAASTSSSASPSTDTTDKKMSWSDVASKPPTASSQASNFANGSAGPSGESSSVVKDLTNPVYKKLSLKSGIINKMSHAELMQAITILNLSPK